MKSYLLKIVLLIGCLVLGGAVFVFAQVDPFAKLTYPIPELGNCRDKTACEIFCDKQENMKSCVNFAKAHNLLPQKDIEMAERMLDLGEAEGPGGCKTMNECETYCDQLGNIKECIAFAEKNNLIPADELDEAKKVIKAIDKGLTPPKCKGKKECDVYCSKPENMKECIIFAKEAGLMPPEELQDAEKMLEALKKGAKPPNCAGKKECDIYCSQPEHMEECMEFGIAAGFIPREEIENVKKTLNAIKQGACPPNCQGREECDIYCSQPEHMEECMEFGIAAGFIPQEEIDGAKGALKALKQGIKPPNCRGEEECNVYCSQPEHMRECMEFSIAAGFMKPEDMENAKKTLQALKKGVKPPNCKNEEECNVYCSQEEHFEECVNFAEAAGFMSPEDADRARKGGGKGPGGCKTEEECEAFCSNPENMEICIDFSVKMGEMSPEEAEQMRRGGGEEQMLATPGGCETLEECEAFCSKPENIQECTRFMSEMEQIQQMPAEGMLQQPPEGTQQPFEGEARPPMEGIQPSEGQMIPPSFEQVPEGTRQEPSIESSQPILRIIKNFLADVSSVFLK